MRRQGAVLLAAGLIALAVGRPAASQPAGPGDLPVYHRHLRTLEFPVDTARLDQLPQKPSELQLFYRTSAGRWQAGPRAAVASLPVISDGKRGFRFTVPDDGEFEFAIQFIYPDGSKSPEDGKLLPNQRVIVDSTPPGISVKVNGKAVEWTTTDAGPNLTVGLQCKWAKDKTGREYGLDEGEWFPIEPKGRGPFRPRDGFDWAGILPQGQELWVRVSAKDPAGNEGFSPPVKIPGSGMFGTGFPKTVDPGGSNPGGPLPNTPQPRIQYVNTLDVTVDYTLRKVTRSGVKALHLYVQTEKEPTRWQYVDKTAVDIPAGNNERPMPLKYRAEKEGLYGFYVVPESGAGQMDDSPGKDGRNDPPMILVMVDKSPPFAKITGVQPRRGGPKGPIVDITWKVVDPNLMPKSISLEYSVDKNAPVWKRIEYGLDNDPASKETGRYEWQVPDESLWKFWVRIRAVDQAANTGEHVWEQQVIVDLDKPNGVITGVRGGNNSGPQPQPNPKQDPVPNPDRPLPMNPMTPTVPEPKGGPQLPTLPEKMP